jgi:hypothetical protein
MPGCNQSPCPRFRQEARALMLISRDEHQMLVVSVVLVLFVPLVLSLRADFGGDGLC